MKKIFLLVFAFYITNAKAQNPSIPSKFLQELTEIPDMICCPDNTGEYVTVFEDNFNDPSSLNTNWYTALGYGFDDPCYRFRLDHEPIYFSPENVTYGKTLDENGEEIDAMFLKVDNAPEGLTCTSKGKTVTAKYTAGMIWGKAEYRYGKFELKFKIPGGGTQALWPAFWLWGGDEIDIMEGWGFSDWGYPTSMHWSTAVQNGPMVNPSSNFLAQGVRSPNEIPIMEKGVWNTLTCEYTPYKISMSLNGDVIKDFYRYYQICGNDTIGVECSSPRHCDGPFIEDISISDAPMHVVVNFTLMPIYEWWNGMLVSESETDLPASLELAYIKVQQLKPPGATNEPNLGTVWGRCQNEDMCVTRFQERELYESGNPSKLCGRERVFNLESSWQRYWDPAVFDCSNMPFTSDPGLNAVLNCNPDKATVSVSADNYDVPYAFQLEIPKSTNSSCISEAGRIIKHTIKFIQDLPKIPSYLDQTIQINPEATYNSLNVGTQHTIKFKFNDLEPQIPAKFWWEINGIKYPDFANDVNFYVLGGTNTLKLFLDNGNGCITQVNYYIHGLCPSLSVITAYIDANIALQPASTYNSLYAGEEHSITFHMNDIPEPLAVSYFYWTVNGTKYAENALLAKFIVQQGVNTIKLYIKYDNGCESEFTYYINGLCPAYFSSSNDKIVFDKVYACTNNGISCSFIQNVELASTSAPCANTFQFKSNIGTHTFKYNYSGLLNGGLTVVFKDQNGAVINPIADDGMVKTYSLFFVSGFNCIEQTVQNPSNTCTKKIYYQFLAGCYPENIVKFNEQMVTPQSTIYVANTASNLLSVDASSINGFPVDVVWQIIPPSGGANSVSYNQPSLIYTFDVYGFYTIYVSITLADGSKYCINFQVRSSCYFPVYSIDNVNYNPTNEVQGMELCAGMHSISISNLQSFNGIVTGGIVKKNNQTIAQITSNDPIQFNLAETDYYQFVYSYSTNCGNSSYVFAVKGKNCGQSNPMPDCNFSTSPNPASYYVDLNSTGSITYAGNTYTPRIAEVKVYDKYNVLRKQITTGDVPSYNLNVGDLPDNDFYIVEIKDQYGYVCRKTLLIAR